MSAPKTKLAEEYDPINYNPFVTEEPSPRTIIVESKGGIQPLTVPFALIMAALAGILVHWGMISGQVNPHVANYLSATIGTITFVGIIGISIIIGPKKWMKNHLLLIDSFLQNFLFQPF